MYNVYTSDRNRLSIVICSLKLFCMQINTYIYLYKIFPLNKSSICVNYKTTYIINVYKIILLPEN